ncbi:ABC transporter permease [Acidobacteriota bacterium]
MLKNYIKTAFQNIKKHKGYSFINIFGLAIGISCCLLILLYVKQELSYDNIYSQTDKIYRVATEVTRHDRVSRIAASPTPLGPALKNEFPEIEHTTRLFLADQVLIEFEEKQILEDEVIYADPNFLTVFPFKLIEGDANHLLDTPNSMLLTSSAAEKYFGDKNPLGKIMLVNNEEVFTVKGVIEDVPFNSHFHFDFALSFLALNEDNFGTWLNLWTGYTDLYTYAVLPQTLDITAFSKKSEDVITRHSGIKPGITRKIFYQPLKRIHLHSHLESEIEQNNSVSNLIILTSIAILILLIACINYMNLFIAQSTKRAKEVGMRKVLGASRTQLIKQFIGESLFFTLISFILSLILAELLLPLFSGLVGKPVYFITGNNLTFLVVFFFITLSIGALSNIYPAVFLSRQPPVKALKGMKHTDLRSVGQVFLKKGLVVFQFAVAIILVIGTLVINQQLHYMRTTQLGFNKEQTAVIPFLNNSGPENFQAIKQDLVAYPAVLSASACLTTPIGVNNLAVNAFPEGQKDKNFIINMNFIDLDFLDLFGIEMVSGRKFSNEFVSDRSESVIVNETTLEKLGITSSQEAIGKKIATGFYNFKGTIVGVAKDFHISSFHEEIEPLIFLYNPQYFFQLAVKLKSQDLPATMSLLEKTWSKHIPDYPFTFSFLDEDINRLYRSEEQTALIIRTFSMVAILIACLGLFSLAAFSAERRTKEIGIRKILGAPTTNIFLLLSMEFTKWVLAANLIAWPIAFFILNSWLGHFAYRVKISWIVFLLTAVLTFLIALFTVSFQSIKTSLSNPIKSLRYE